QPFAAINDAPMAMTAHIAYPSIDPEAPATLSRPLISNIVRGRIGFDGLLMTDDLGMKALGGTLTARANSAISAGCDVVLHCSGFVKDPDAIVAEMREVGEAVPLLSGDPLRRAQRAEQFATLEKPFDAKAGWQRFKTLLADVEAVA
ncbi:MAG: glycoside hydrolase family 3 N-terminal domain-containing protein, partial [Pseudomonadota bacterium]